MQAIYHKGSSGVHSGYYFMQIQGSKLQLLAIILNYAVRASLVKEGFL